MARNKKSFKGSGADLFLTPGPTTVAVEATSKELKINPAFQALIPPLSEEEYAQLEENLLENGIREAISVWGDTIVDGHNRYEIAQKHNLSYTTISYEFDSEDDVKLWIFKNQIGRRNLPPFERVKLALHLKPVIAEKAKLQQLRKKPADFVLQNSAKQNEDTDNSLLTNLSKQNEDQIDSVLEISEKQEEAPADNFVPQNSAEQNPMETRKIIASLSGVSHDTVSKVEKILNSGTPETLEKVRRGDITVHKAYQETRSQEKKDEALASGKSHPSFPDVDGIFSVIYADPPWETKLLNDGEESIDSHSPAMSLGDLKQLEFPAAEDAVLLLWSYASVLDKALQLMNSWGFKYRTNMIWDKQHVGLGEYVRGQHEMLLIGVRGNFDPPPKDTRVGSVYSEEGGSHNAKPKWFYEQIEKMFPNETFLELFSSIKYSDRWTVFGNPVESQEVDSE